MAIFESIDNAIIKNINTNNIITNIVNNSSLIQNCNSKTQLYNQLLGSNNIIYNCISSIPLITIDNISVLNGNNNHLINTQI
jgi:hypothetical protein